MAQRKSEIRSLPFGVRWSDSALVLGDLSPGLTVASTGRWSRLVATDQSADRPAHSKGVVKMFEETETSEPFDALDSIDPYDPFPEPVVIPITDVFDLHTIQPRDVKLVVEEYLQEARRLGFRSVRIIHGKGKGVQREIVRSILEKTPFVIDWTDAPPEAGGLGATIVRLQSE